MIKAVFFDAINTIFSPYPSQVGLYKKVIFDATGKDLTEAEIRPILERAMAETEALSSSFEKSIQQWEYFPTKIAELIGCEAEECSIIGSKLRYETWGNPDNYRLYNDILPTLELLREKGIYVACVSNEDGWLPSFFEHFEITKYFEFILTSAEVQIEKPNPEIFQIALAKTEFTADEVLFVGDSLVSDYQGSQGLGMKSLLIDRDGLNKDNSVVAVSDLTKILEYL